jgi:hypothetical protein
MTVNHDADFFYLFYWTAVNCQDYSPLVVDEYDYGASTEWYGYEKPKYAGEKHVPMPPVHHKSHMD